jgi:hypothetical protein
VYLIRWRETYPETVARGERTRKDNRLR